MVKPTKQSPGEMVIELLKFRSKKHSRNITIDQLKKAEDKVGASADDRLEWCLRFANADTKRFTLPDLFNAQLELAAFRSRPKAMFADIGGRSANTETVSSASGLFPTEEEVARTYKFFRSILESFVGEREVSFDYEGKTSVVLREIRDDEWALSQTSMDYVANCGIELVQLLQVKGGLVRKCDTKEEGCGRWFLAKRTDAVYCTKTCLNTAMSRKRRARLVKDKSEGRHASKTR